MIDQSERAHGHRLRAFGITTAALKTLQGNAAFARDSLPAILDSLHDAFAPWPEVQHALRQPAVHGPRLAHWARVICGGFGDGFYASAQALAEALYRHGVPASAVTLCHRIVVTALTERLATATSGIWPWAGERDRAAMAEALSAATWLDLEVLLETYAVAEQDARRALLQGFAQRFETGVNGVIGGVKASTEQLATSVRGMGETAARASEQMVAAAGAAREASGNVTTVAAATEELTASIGEITRQVTQSASIATLAVRRAAETDMVVQTLSEAAGRIGDVVRLIGQIAGQTNLLALNATIEAARAGEAGKGFAVVASEVKGLASQTSRATDDIRAQIEQMQAATQNAVQAIRSISGTVGEMGSIATAIAAAVEEQGCATAEISRSVQGAAAGNRVVDEQMEGLRQTATISRRRVDEVDQVTRTLSSRVSDLSGSVQEFLRQVRAA